MRTEWQSDKPPAPAGRGNRDGAPSVAVASTSWNARRLIGVGGVMALACFGGGLALAEITTPQRPLGAAPVTAPTPGEPPVTEIGDAVATTRDGLLAPAPTEDLLVVRISVNVCGDRSSGTAVLIADGLLLTAAHVVGDAALVRIDHGAMTVTGEVLGVLVDGSDLALVAVDAPLAEPVAIVAPPAVGAAVTVIGFPENERRTITVGPRVELATEVASRAGSGAVGVAATTGPGFSGGPALAPGGGLFGIAVASELATDTALVLPLDGIGRLDETVVVPGRCATDA